MYEAAIPTWVVWAVGGAGVLVVLISLVPYLKPLVPFLASAKEPDPIAAFSALKCHCKECPEACEALKVVWKHLEPEHGEHEEVKS